ncbi:hypothetical protein FHS40_004699 [Streptomyces spectabilis]|uniref:Uncharacterized protein n=1 Tax=Streptomyces spectabilis TaxID=68270 RepID=A0A7W8AVU7_STRST|nr:hypothetical protein [Streptomyces spectabilis]
MPKPAPPDQDPDRFRTSPPPEGHANYRFAWSAWVQLLYHQQTKNLLVSYSPKKLGFF